MKTTEELSSLIARSFFCAATGRSAEALDLYKQATSTTKDAAASCYALAGLALSVATADWERPGRIAAEVVMGGTDVDPGGTIASAVAGFVAAIGNHDTAGALAVYTQVMSDDSGGQSLAVFMSILYRLALDAYRTVIGQIG